MQLQKRGLFGHSQVIFYRDILDMWFQTQCTNLTVAKKYVKGETNKAKPLKSIQQGNCLFKSKSNSNW